VGAVHFYPEAEAVLARLPRRGVPMILKAVKDAPAVPFSIMAMDKRVRKHRVALGLPSTFTLDACRHGGMTELEVAELTDGQAAPYRGTAPSALMEDTPSARWNAPCPPPASATPTGWRTRRERKFRMSHGQTFGMEEPTMTQRLRKPLKEANNLSCEATWRSGYATVCKTVYSGSIPDVASTIKSKTSAHLLPRKINSEK
jgi:hypothetical protein